VGPAALGHSHDRHHTARLHEGCHARQSGILVEVMQGRHARDDIERFVFEPVRESVPADERDIRRALLRGERDARCIDVDSDDRWHALTKRSGEAAFATTDIKG
jgi:hypothetical protein